MPDSSITFLLFGLFIKTNCDISAKIGLVQALRLEPAPIVYWRVDPTLMWGAFDP